MIYEFWAVWITALEAKQESYGCTSAALAIDTTII